MRAASNLAASAAHSQRNEGSTFVSSYTNITDRQSIEAYLGRHSLLFKPVNEHVVVKECPFCHPTAGKVDNQWKLYILNRNGCFKCFRCQSQGSWYDFQSKIRGRNGSSISVAPVMKGAPKPDAPPIPAVLPAAGTAEEQVAHLLQSKQAMDYLTAERGLTKETLAKYGVGLSKLSFDSGPEWCLSFPWFEPGAGTMVRYKARALSSKGKQRLVPKGGGWSLFGLNTVGDATEVVLTEGEFDAMAVHQATGMAAISLPNGAGSLPVEVLPMLERFSKIYLWMDQDTAGMEAIPKFVKKLGKGRTSVVNGITKGEDGKQKLYKDANDALRDGADLSAMLHEARPEPHEQIVSFGMLRNELHQNMMFPERHAGKQSRSLPKLDAILKGHRRGEMTVVTGPTGSGKTTFLSQLSLDYCEQQVPTLWASFEILNTRLAQKMLAQHGRKLGKKGEGLPLTVENFEEIADSFEQLPLHFLRFHGSSDVDEVLDAMDYACYAHDVEHIVLDNLQFMLSGQGRGYDRFDAQDRAIEKFRKFATQKDVHVTLVIHPRKEQDGEPLGITSVFGGAKATQEADNIVMIQHLQKQGPEAAVDLKYVEVKKNRYDGQLGRVYLKFLPGYSCYVEETKLGNLKV